METMKIAIEFDVHNDYPNTTKIKIIKILTKIIFKVLSKSDVVIKNFRID